MKIYISASWKNRANVRLLATVLRKANHEVYDFTDPLYRNMPEIPPESFPELFNPATHNYKDYLNRPEWKNAVSENRQAIEWADLIILLLPCGIDSTADWALGVGLGKMSVIVGCPVAGERCPTHLWADAMLDNMSEILPWIDELQDRRLAG